MAKRKTTTRRSKTKVKRPTTRPIRKPKPPRPGPLKRWWTGLADDGRRRVKATVAKAVLLIVLVGGAGVGMYYLRDYVMAMPVYADNEATIDLAGRPEWMSDRLAGEIRYELMTRQGPDARTFDPNLTGRVYEAARMCPWIREVRDVRIQRAPAAGDGGLYGAGRVIVDAEYRRPAAIVASNGGRAEFVDDHGVVLPHLQASQLAVAADLARIVGVAQTAPAEGRPWAGADLTAGLTMLKLLRPKPYFAEIAVVDVTNFQRRQSMTDPAMSMVAVAEDRVTEIRFGQLPLDGRPPISEPSLQRKLAYLDSWYRSNHSHLAGPAYLDLRYSDQITYSAEYAVTPE